MCEEPRNAGDLFAARGEASRDAGPVGRAFFADAFPTPEDARIRLDDTVLLLNLSDAALLTVVREFGSIGPDGDGDELIAGIPLEGADAVGGEIAIRVNCEL